MRVRFARIPGETPKTVLRKALFLPATIGAIGVTEEAQHTEYDTIRAGQFSQPAQGPVTARRLRSVDDIETLTVEWDPVWLVERGQDPADVRRQLYAILRSRRGVELLMTPKLGETGAEFIRFAVTIRAISMQIRRGEPDTVYFTLKLSEWRNAAIKRKGQGTRGSKLPTTHRLTAQDTLHSLSQLYYLTSAHGRLIAKANKIKGVGLSTRLVLMKRFKVNSKIRIPKLPEGTPEPTPLRFRDP